MEKNKRKLGITERRRAGLTKKNPKKTRDLTGIAGKRERGHSDCGELGMLGKRRKSSRERRGRSANAAGRALPSAGGTGALIGAVSVN